MNRLIVDFTGFPPRHVAYYSNCFSIERLFDTFQNFDFTYRTIRIDNETAYHATFDFMRISTARIFAYFVDVVDKTTLTSRKFGLNIYTFVFIYRNKTLMLGIGRRSGTYTTLLSINSGRDKG